jgi:uncharacterized membrane protein YcaP (DUF421 family)
MEDLFNDVNLFSDVDQMVRIFITTLLTYPALLVVLRVFGKRSLSKMNMFDFIVTIALGSIFAATILQSAISIIDGAIGFTMLLVGQFIVTWTSTRWEQIDRLVKAGPTLVYFNDQFLEEAMRDVRVTQEEILAAMRQQGIGTLQKVHAVVLENNGVLSVIPVGEGPVQHSTLQDVSGFDQYVH